MKTKRVSNTCFTAAFESISEYGEWLENLGHVRDQGARTASAKPQCDKWDSGDTYEKALDRVLMGGEWSAGADALQRIDINAGVLTSNAVSEPALELMQTGGVVDISEYLSGSPECFLGVEELPRSKPVIRVAVVSVCSVSMTATQMLNRGRAILAVIDALESQNYSVELKVVDMGAHRENGVIYQARYEVTIKKAGEHWAPANVAYPLAHASWSRRLGFRAIESAPNGLGHRLTINGYGSITRINEIMASDDADIVFNSPDHNSYKTPEDALSCVLADIKKQKPDLLQSVMAA